MSTLKARLAVLLTVFSAVIGLIVWPTGGVDATTAPSGWSRESGSLLGPTPLGLRVVIDRAAPHRDDLYRLGGTVTAQLRALGLPVTFGGWGSATLGNGRLAVTANTSGCAGGAAAVTRTTQLRLTDGHTVVHGAQIAVCPSTFRLVSWKWLTVLRHEFGHAVGLGHYNTTFRGQWQVMFGADARVRDYQAGDLAGLHWLASNRSFTRLHYPLTTSVAENFVTGTILATGTVRNPADPNAAIAVSLTDNGQAASLPLQVDPITHQFVLTWLWPGAGTHLVCVAARTVGTSSASSVCYSWQ